MKGFTLVEILVVIAIVAILGTILVAIFVNTLRGSNKSQLLAVIKQNGQAVLEDMDKTARGADHIICPPDSTPRDTLAVVKEGTFTRYRFKAQTIESNGFIQKDKPAKQIVEGTGREETDNEFINRICNTNIPIIDVDAAILTDTNPQSGVSVESGDFTRSPEAGFNDSITVRFTLKPGVGIPPIIADQVGTVEFKTTIGLR